MDGAEAGGERDILEAAAARVPVEEVVDAGKHLRAAVVPAPVLLGAGLRRIVAHVARHVEVEPAVGVVVAERGGGGPTGAGDPGGVGHVVEAAVAEAAVKAIGAVVRDEQVGEAIAVVVAGGEAHPVPGVGGPRGFAPVGEAARGTLEVEDVSGRLGAGAGRVCRAPALEQVDIEVAVAVGVEEAASGAGDFGEREVALVAGVVDEADSSLLRHVGEALGGRGRREERGERRGEREAGPGRSLQGGLSIGRGSSPAGNRSMGVCVFPGDGPKRRRPRRTGPANRRDIAMDTGNGTIRRIAGLGAVFAVSGCVLHIDGGGSSRADSGWSAMWDEDRCAVRDTVDLSAPAGESLFVYSGPGAVAIAGSAEATGFAAEATLCASSRELLEEMSVRLADGRLEASVPERRGGWFDNNYARIDLDVRVPTGTAIRLDDGSGSVRISDVGAVEIEDGSGSLVLERTGPVRVDDGSGSLQITEVRGDAVVEDGSGGLRIRGVEGNLSVEDGSGGLRIAEVTGDLRLDDSSGSVRIHDVGGSVLIGDDGSGSLEIERVGGDVEVVDAGAGGVEVRDVEGDLRVRGTKRSRVSYADVRGEVDLPER